MSNFPGFHEVYGYSIPQHNAPYHRSSQPHRKQARRFDLLRAQSVISTAKTVIPTPPPVIPILRRKERNLGIGGPTPPQIPRPFAPRNHSCWLAPAPQWAIRVTSILARGLMLGCSSHLRFLAALPPKGWCRNDEVCGRRSAILFSGQ